MGITTLSVDDETKERFDDARPDDCRSAGEFINRLLDAWEDDPAFAGEGLILPEDITGELVEEFAVAVEPEQGMVDDTKLARDVAGHIDYVELAGKVADELEGRLR